MAASKSGEAVIKAKRKRPRTEDGKAAGSQGGALAERRKKSRVTDLKKATPGKFAKNKVDVKAAPGHFTKNKGDVKAEKVLDRKGRKELAELRKKRRKPYYDLEKEVKALWEKMRQRNLEKTERARLVSETLKKMKGKLAEMGGSHVASRVLQACVKFCKQSERDAVFDELRPHTLALSRNTYAYHLVIKMLDHANKLQLQQMLSILHGHVVALLRHPVGSAVVEHAYQLANGAQKHELVCEFYSPEYRLFKGVAGGKGSLSDLMASEPVSKQNSILEHMTLSLQPILEKGIVDHSITHRALVEYLSVCKKIMVEDVVKSLAGPLLVRMIHTKDGAKVGVTCVKLSTAKERKSIIRSMKGHVLKIAQDEHSSIVLLAILDVVDDTKLVSKIIIRELQKELKDLASHKYGRRWLLHLLAPGVARYFPPDVLTVLRNSPGGESGPKTVPETQVDEEKAKAENSDSDDDDDDGKTGKEVRGVSKKDPAVRRYELLSAGGLAKDLAKVCTESAEELLESALGTDLIYEVAMGGLEGVMWQIAPDEILSLHKAIAVLAAKPPLTGVISEAGREHVLEQYYASRTIRRLILNSESPPKGIEAPSFSTTLWGTALRAKCRLWVKGHSLKVVTAYKTCADKSAKEAAEKEIQGLTEAGVLQQS